MAREEPGQGTLGQAMKVRLAYLGMWTLSCRLLGLMEGF